MSEITATEYLYGIDSSVNDDTRYYQAPRVVQFRITRKTAKRVYYFPDDVGTERSKRERFVDRATLEQDGQASRKSGSWWESDLTVYLKPPVIEQAQQPSLAELKSAMADAHPDRGGTDEAFIAERARYERARSTDFPRSTSVGQQKEPTEGDRVT